MLVLLGKSTAGKDTVQKELVKMGLKPIVSYTTRPRRKGEEDGIDYHFISRKEFLTKVTEGFFAETTYYNVAQYERWYYGTAVEDIQDDRVCILNPDGLNQMKMARGVHIVSFYLRISDDVQRVRLVRRGGNALEAQRRFEEDNVDFYRIEEVVDYVFSNNGELKPALVADMIRYTYNKTIGGMNENI